MIWILLVPLLLSLGLAVFGGWVIKSTFDSRGSDHFGFDMMFRFFGILMVVAGTLSAASLAVVLWKFH